jgi:hypothetical protein
MLTEAQETGYIHGLLPRLQDPDNSILIAEDLATAGYSYKETNAVIERLEAESLARRGFSTTVILTTYGRQVARDPRGYLAHLRRQRRQARIKEIREWLGAYGSLIGGVGGIVGAAVATLSLIDSRRTAGEMDNMRTQLRELTYTQATANTRMTLLERQTSQAARSVPNLTLPVHRDHAQQRTHKR